MQSLSLLDKIKSKYISEKIFGYIKDKSCILKILKYCKRLQGIYNLEIKDYKTKSFEILNYSKFEYFLSSRSVSKYYLKDMLESDLEKYDKKIKNIIKEFSEIFFTNKYNYYKSNEPIKKNILDNQLIIDIYSPFFKNLSKISIFQDLFIIRIPIPFILTNKIIKNYIKKFEELNKSNINYSSLCLQFDPYTDEYLSDIQKFNINYQKIKKLIFEEKKRYKYKTNIYKHEELLLFKTIIRNSNIINNLLFLEIKNKQSNYNPLVYNLDNINHFKCLEELRLENVSLSKYFTLKLNTLKYLALCNCYQIAISENCALNLKSLSLFRSYLNRSGPLNLKLPELEQLKISFCFYHYFFYQKHFNQIIWYQEFMQLIDVKSLKKLKFLFRGDISLLLALENNSIEKAYISSYTLNYEDNSIYNKEQEVKMIKKFIEIKTLKEIKLNLSFINSNDIEKIEGENTSVKKLIIDWHKENNDDNLLYNLQKKFPNLTDLEIYNCYQIKKIN